MGKNLLRGAVAVAAAAALAVPVAGVANAALIDPDPNWNIQPVAGPGVYRIADKDRIATAIEASQTRDDWGFKSTRLVWKCDDTTRPLHNNPAQGSWVAGNTVQVPTASVGGLSTCTATVVNNWSVRHILVARADDYSDALAATTLADVTNAPVLLNPTAELDPRNRAEIARLAAGQNWTSVSLLGGTNALSHTVENAINAIPGVNVTFRHQGIDRYETAVEISKISILFFGGILANDEVNVYLTTGVDFADALAAGTSAAQNDGVVLLTKGDELDRRGFTENFLIDLQDLVIDEAPFVSFNTSEIFAVGGPAVRAARTYDIRVADEYLGADRYETAVLAARGTFGNPKHFAVTSGLNYPDAVVASSYIANADGPLLLSKPNTLTPVTAGYLADKVENGDSVITFGGTDTLTNAVTNQIAELFNY
ncbi:MAG: cell wall-binding repeat-containing protein [Propioniciclava sp.]